MRLFKQMITCIKNPKIIFYRLRCHYWRKKFKTPHYVNINGRIRVENPKKISVGCNVSMNEGLFIGGSEKVTIGDWVHISPYVCINTGGLNIATFRSSRKHFYLPVIIEDGVWIGSNALINPGVRLGHDCVIGAGAVVTKDIPPYAVAVGVPARVIRTLNPENQITTPGA